MNDNPYATGFFIGTQKRNFRIQFTKIEKNVSPSDNQDNSHSIFVKQKNLLSASIFVN